MRILLVDDSKTMRNIQKSVLAQIGHTDIMEACDGQDALAKVGVYRPELLLVDWNMPVMDGLAFVKAFRGQYGRGTPIIMVTTESEKMRVVEAIKAGINNYVVKPFTPDGLGQRIGETMAKVQAMQAQAAAWGLGRRDGASGMGVRPVGVLPTAGVAGTPATPAISAMPGNPAVSSTPASSASATPVRASMERGLMGIPGLPPIPGINGGGRDEPGRVPSAWSPRAFGGG